MANADKQRHDKLEPNAKHNRLLPGREWPLDLGAVRIPTHPPLNEMHSADDNDVVEQRMIRKGKDKFCESKPLIDLNCLILVDVTDEGDSVTKLEQSHIQDAHGSLHGSDEFENNGSARVRSGTGEAEVLSTSHVSNLSGSNNNRGDACCGISLVEEDVSMMSVEDLGAEEIIGEEEFREMAEDLESDEPETKCE
jgi:hypothetical protein